jgi:hypothetical protein
MTMQQQHEFSPFVDQATIAEMLSVNRSTINRYQHLGMPYVAGETGESNRYDVGLCANWAGGHNLATKRKIRMTSLEKIMWGAAWGSAEKSFARWRARNMFADRMNASGEEVAGACGFLRGAGLLPWD